MPRPISRNAFARPYRRFLTDKPPSAHDSGPNAGVRIRIKVMQPTKPTTGPANWHGKGLVRVLLLIVAAVAIVALASMFGIARARADTPEALKVLASIAVDASAPAGDREKARKALAKRLGQLGDQLSPDLRRELENAVHGK
jgi:anti-sigma-K factor RskA